MTTKSNLKVAIVGCGVIGGRRSENLPAGTQVTSLFDTDQSKAQSLSKKFSDSLVFDSLDKLIAAKNSDVAIVATINSSLVETTQKLLNAGIHCIVEKPAARNIAELSSLKIPNGAHLKIGFNHRFHPAFEEIQKRILARPDDPIMFIRARYGNGARVGFDREWRSKVELAGGGELLDQGVHVLDLAGVLLPQLEVKTAWCRTHFWQMPVDDNSWAILSTPQGQTFSFHVSSSEWKNEFRFEVYTRQTKYVWNGLGRSYGPETLTIFKMKPEMGPPDVEEIKYSSEDNSWLNENQHFFKFLREPEGKLLGNYGDAKRSLSWVEKIYQASFEFQKNSSFRPVEFLQGNPTK